VSERQIVYENTWYLPTAPQSWDRHDRLIPDTVPKDSPFVCDFGIVPIPIFDYVSPDPKRTAVRVVVLDNPTFFHFLAESDRQWLLLDLAHGLVMMLRDGLSRLQYGFGVKVLDEEFYSALEYPHVEYYFTLIESNLDGNESRPRLVANIRSGAPCGKTRRLFGKMDDVARRVQERLGAEDSLEEDT
jgi:hypothetical protein